MTAKTEGRSGKVAKTRAAGLGQPIAQRPRFKHEVFMRAATLGMVLGMMTACGSAEHHMQENSSQVDFIIVGNNVTGLVAKAKAPTIRTCLTGVSASQKDTWEKNIQSVMLKWLQPMRALTSDKLTSTIEVVDSASGNCDSEVQVSPGASAVTYIGQRPVTRMGSSGYFASYNVLLHEFGHGFALSDTYQNGTSGNCKPGQPQAVMCNTSFSELQPDDIAGVTKIFKAVFPNDQPGTTPPEDSRVSLGVALGKEEGADTYRLYAGVSTSVITTSAAAPTVSYCLGARDKCTLATASYVDFEQVGSVGNVPLYATKTGVKLEDGLRITVRFLTDATVNYKAISIERDGI